ncbi:HAD domain-containing protein [Pseudomonas capsici]|uniref:HAD domain-containing protein n=1 Tax=Pseudomonas capsici TaxID=2810614 RepID=UPI0021F12187|nr:HAD domain-containing protein [Pseudomonas capsici]MCV4284708.1 HAD domain-containing protein [Pseudomonas capsici]
MDFYGVLHPDSVFLTRKGPKLRSEGELFMWIGLPEAVFHDFPNIQILLSTSWVRNIGFSRTIKRLSPVIQQRVVGATWHSSMATGWADANWWDQFSRYGQIVRYVARSAVSDWIAIDDDSKGWAEADRHRLVAVDPTLGLSENRAVAELRSKLSPFRASDRLIGP